MSAEGTGRAAFHSASSVPSPVFRGLRMICGTSNKRCLGRPLDSATLLSCPISDSGCTEDHKSNIRTSIMLENNAFTKSFTDRHLQRRIGRGIVENRPRWAPATTYLARLIRQVLSNSVTKGQALKWRKQKSGPA